MIHIGGTTRKMDLFLSSGTLLQAVEEDRTSRESLEEEVWDSRLRMTKSRYCPHLYFAPS